MITKKQQQQHETEIHSREQLSGSNSLYLTLSGIEAHSGVGRVGEFIAVEHVTQTKAFNDEFLARWSHSWKEDEGGKGGSSDGQNKLKQNYEGDSQ